MVIAERVGSAVLACLVTAGLAIGSRTTEVSPRRDAPGWRAAPCLDIACLRRRAAVWVDEAAPISDDVFEQLARSRIVDSCRWRHPGPPTDVYVRFDGWHVQAAAEAMIINGVPNTDVAACIEAAFQVATLPAAGVGDSNKRAGFVLFRP